MSMFTFVGKCFQLYPAFDCFYSGCLSECLNHCVVKAAKLIIKILHNLIVTSF